MILHLAIQIYIILPHFNILPYVYLYFLTIFNIQFTQKFIKHDSHFEQKKSTRIRTNPKRANLPTERPRRYPSYLFVFIAE